VDSISQHEREISESFRICELMYEAFRSEFRVILGSGGVTIMKRKDACFDVSDMLVGPLNFEMGVFENGHLSCSDCAMIAP
jgi:hypothetical protein